MDKPLALKMRYQFEFGSVDIGMLTEQRNILLNMREHSASLEETDAIDGIINMTDAMMDYAVEASR